MADKKISDFTAKADKDIGDLGEIEDGASGNSRKVRAGVDGTACGTAFPGSPTTGDRFWRSDRSIEYFYDGTRWLSTQLYNIEVVPTDALLPASVTGNHHGAPNPWSGLYDIYVTETAISVISVGTLNWTVAVASVGTGAATLSSFVISSAVDALTRTAVNLVVPSTIHRFGVPLTENSGTGSIYVQPSIIYRLIG